MYSKLKTDRVCEDEFSKTFEEYIVSSAVYSDDTYKKKLFTYDEYKALPTVVKTALKDGYNKTAIDGESVKN
jgi:hypothetical protein